MLKKLHGLHIFSLLCYIMLTAPLAQASFLESLFAPDAELWPRWQAHDPADQRTIDHSAWDGFLKKYTSLAQDGVVRVDYAGVTTDDINLLQQYIDSLTSTQITGFSRDQQFAYWVNLYNALTLATVLEHYPVESIRDIDLSTGFLADGPWAKKLVEIEDEPVSLDDIEHRILRPIWQDPRIHYAVNCASIGCPNLAQEAFTADNLERLLNAGAVAYVNHPRGISVDEALLTISSIYNWFADDFDRDGGILSHIRLYAEPALQQSLENAPTHRRFRYDWNLNSMAPASE